MAFRVPSPREEAFVNGWTDAWAFPQRHEYWNPRAGAWEAYKPGTYSIGDAGIPPPDIKNLGDPEEIYPKVEESWASIRNEHSTAVLDPKTREWRTATLLKPPDKPDGPGKGGDDPKERERLALKELEEADRQYRNRILNHDEWMRRRKEIRQKYGLE
jgi:hypothetical protein